MTCHDGSCRQKIEQLTIESSNLLYGMNMQSPMILIVEDEEDLAAAVAYAFRQERFRTRVVYSGEDALLSIEESPPDIVLLDLMLPKISGAEVCRRIRKQGIRIPIIMATAMGEERDRLFGFEVGADDYVVKPYSIRELILRVQAILRRSATDAKNTVESLEEDVIRIDILGHRVWVSEKLTRLTSLEFRLLRTLMERRGRVLSRGKLLTDVWGYHEGMSTRTVDTHIKRLRVKLRDAGNLIETVRGVGYRFANA